MNTATVNTMTNRQLYGVVAIALVIALVLGALGWTSRPNISISITVTPAPVQSFADFAKQYGVSDNVGQGVAQALAPAQVAQLAQAPVPTAAAVIRPKLPDPPMVQAVAPETGNYNVAVDENPTFERIVLLENVWFQCRKAALAPTATALQATPVVVAVATAETLPPDVNLGWAVRKEAGGQVSFGYVTNQAQPQTYFTCTQLDSDVRFAGLSTYQQRVVREMCS